MEHDEAGCQAAPEGPFLCINNCGFFGSAATMNMCSKCHKDMMLKQEQAKLAASSIGSIVNGSTSRNSSENVDEANVDLQVGLEILKSVPKEEESSELDSKIIEGRPNEGPRRCTSCNKRVGLTGFNCRCGDLFCRVHRYSDKHNCPFDYRSKGQDAIVKANPVMKAEKLDKI